LGLGWPEIALIQALVGPQEFIHCPEYFVERAVALIRVRVRARAT
jgi:hypothetical protein